jgi:hypothetical protein
LRRSPTNNLSLNMTKMTDKQILEELHRRLQDYSSSFRREGHLGVNRYDIKDFIEQEWSKRDEGASLNSTATED